MLALCKINRAPASARNCGLTCAPAEYLAFIGCNDWAEPDKDLALHLAVPALSQKVVYIPMGYYHYRQHGQSMTATYNLNRSLEVMSALNYALQFYPLRANRGWEAVEVVKRLKAYINGSFPGWKSNRYLRGQLTMKQKVLLYVLLS